MSSKFNDAGLMYPHRPGFVYDKLGILVSYKGKPLFTREALLKKFNDDFMKKAPQDNSFTKAIENYRHVLIHFPNVPGAAEEAHQGLSDIYHKILDEQMESD